MFLYLSKTLPLLIYPLGLACILMAAAIVLRCREALAAGLAAAAVLLLLVFSNGYVAGRLAQTLEWRHLPRSEAVRDYPAADAIVLLGGGTRAVEYPRTMTEVNEAGDRLFQAARLYREGKAPLVIVTGGAIGWMGSSVPEADGMRELLEFLSVPSAAIVADAAAQNTYENALHVRAMADERGIEKIILVTSALHMPRSAAIFEKQGFEVIPAPTDFFATRSGEQGDRLGVPGLLYKLLPDAQYLHITTQVFKEYLGMAVYRARGWM